MSLSINAPPATSSESFTGYDGISLDICEKLTALLAQTEKMRLILDAYVNPDTMLYKQEAIYPGLLPTGTVVMYSTITTSWDEIKREVWRLQRTPEDLDGKNLDADLSPGALWTVVEELRGRFPLGVSLFSEAEKESARNQGENGEPLTSLGASASGGSETVALTMAQGGFVNHTHLLGAYGKDIGAGAGDASFVKTPDKTTNLLEAWTVRTMDSGDIENRPVTKINIRTSYVFEPEKVPGVAKDLPAADEDSEPIDTEPHDNMPPYFTVVYIRRTSRKDSKS
jgi:hypothetical protein